MKVRLFLFTAFCCPWLAAWETPGLVLKEERRLMLVLPRIHLEQPKVARMLRSGLTTTFVFTLKARAVTGTRTLPSGGAKVDVRYEPWDDVYYVKVWHFDGKFENHKLADTDKLSAFFEDGRIALNSPARLTGTLWAVTVTMKVLPFSEREQRETREWFSEKLDENPKREDPNKVLDMLLATSIKRRSVISGSWRLEVEL
ncbi:MAG: hypothetical protein QNK37_16120 [Acidobacteriota bacterium]|nr:hypothetical protein [Acidobacteriota bacterium]